MRTLTAFLTGAILCSTLTAQDCIVRQRVGSPPAFFYGPNTVATLQGIINSSVDGDTIHLPAVEYAFGSTILTVNRGVILVGSGIHPDSTGASFGLRTYFDGGVRFVYTNAATNASNAEFHGITLAWVQFGNAIGNLHSSTNVSGVKFYRCDFGTLHMGMQTTGGAIYNSAATNTLISGCIVRGLLRVHSAANTSIVNSFVGSMTYAPSTTNVANCVFMDFNQAMNNNNAGVLYRSNIFMRATGAANYAITEASTFHNNLWVVQGASTVSWPNAINATGNEQTNNPANVFVNNTSYTDFDFVRDYHVLPAYQGAGYQGTEMGVYGGSSQSVWKDGALPFNPHWQQLEVPLGTSNGILQGVHIKGSAQTH